MCCCPRVPGLVLHAPCRSPGAFLGIALLCTAACGSACFAQRLDAADLLGLARAWQSEDSDFDFNQDGRVDGEDLLWLVRVWHTTPIPPLPTPTPTLPPGEWFDGILGTLATGVTRSDAAGDDAAYARGRSRAFVAHGDGTVTDTNTGLVWVRDPAGAGLGIAYTWSQARDACEQLVYAGHNDWRLPTLEELSTLRNAGRYDPVIDPVFVSKADVIYYWTSTAYANGSGYLWGVSFGLGGVNWCYNLFQYAVRPVRYARPPASRPFADHGDGTATDLNTGLMWVKDPAAAGLGGTYDWSGALAACENLTYAGYSDWRLPNVNELQSLVDYSRYDPAVAAGLACSTDKWYRSSSVHPQDQNYAWCVHFKEGRVNWSRKSYDYYVRPVRGGM